MWLGAESNRRHVDFPVHVSHDGKLFASAAAIQPITAALEAGLMEQEQHYPCSAVLP